MDEDKLKEIWTEMQKETFDAFIKENIGYSDTKGTLPKCFGSGDDRPWCMNCAIQISC